MKREEKSLAYNNCPKPTHPHNLKHETLMTVEPWVKHGLWEAQCISVEHALREAAAVSYLIGRGYHPHHAHQIVESWWHCQ
ncbi:hypothetical protein PMSM_12705 [Paenibacillus macquariensis subsp. macquariensis]|nr:hypothetical protein PMSM_12705 [Paenibacillus macquariensis subsp. macquariensis]